MRRHSGLLAGALSITLLVGACSGSTDGGSASEKEVTVHYMTITDPAAANDPRAAALKTNIADFEKLNANISVDVQVVPYADMLTRLPQMAAANQTPDVIHTFTVAVPVMIKAGVYQPLTDLVADVPKDDWLQPWDSTVFDGEKMVMPYEYRASALLYNKKLLDEAGVAVPTTWDEFLTAAVKLTEAGKIGFASGFSKSQNAAILMEFFDAMLFQLDQPMFNDKGKAVFDTAQGERFFELFKKLKDSGVLPPSVIQGTYENAQESLINGTAAMGILGTHRVKTIQTSNPDIQWAPLPTWADGKKATVITGWTLGIGKSSKNPEAAAKFIEYMTGPAGQAVLATGGEVPARKSAFDDPYFKTADGELVNDVAQYIEKWGQVRKYPPTWEPLTATMAENMQALYLEGKSPADVAKSVVSTYNEQLDD